MGQTVARHRMSSTKDWRTFTTIELQRFQRGACGCTHMDMLCCMMLRLICLAPWCCMCMPALVVGTGRWHAHLPCNALTRSMQYTTAFACILACGEGWTAWVAPLLTDVRFQRCLPSIRAGSHRFLVPMLAAELGPGLKTMPQAHNSLPCELHKRWPHVCMTDKMTSRTDHRL